MTGDLGTARARRHLHAPAPRMSRRLLADAAGTAAVRPARATWRIHLGADAIAARAALRHARQVVLRLATGVADRRRYAALDAGLRDSSTRRGRCRSPRQHRRSGATRRRCRGALQRRPGARGRARQADVAAVLIEPAMTNIGIVLPEPGWHGAGRVRPHGHARSSTRPHPLARSPRPWRDLTLSQERPASVVRRDRPCAGGGGERLDFELRHRSAATARPTECLAQRSAHGLLEHHATRYAGSHRRGPSRHRLAVRRSADRDAP